MKKNMGKSDRILRLIVGVAIVIAGLYYQSWWGLVGIIPIATALLNFCPLYKPLGINTSGKE